MEHYLRTSIITGETDVNNKELFFSALIKGFLYDIRRKISLRGIPVPHFILNTGDDTMYLEVKDHDMSIEPGQVSNEDYVYNQVPRCIVTIGGVTIERDDMTSNTARGMLVYDSGNELTTFNAEFRRIPINLSVTCKYYVDSYTDALALMQMLISKLNFNNLFYIQYMGQSLPVSYMFPEGEDVEMNTEIDGLYQDNKARTITLDLEIESCYPLYKPETVGEADLMIMDTVHRLQEPGDGIQIRTSLEKDDERNEIIRRRD